MARQRKSMTPGAFVHVTCNVVRGQYLYNPNDAFTPRAIGIIRRYQRLYQMKICLVVFLSNHTHMLLNPDSQTQLSDFMRDVNAALARLVQELYGVPGRILARPFDQSEDLDSEAVLQDFLYIMANSVAEGLVSDPRHWPGIHSANELCGGPAQIGEYFDEAAYKAARAEDRSVKMDDFWVREAIELSPIPQHRGLSRHQRQAAVRKMVQQIVRDHEATRVRPVVGAQAILKQDPRFIPESVKISYIPRAKARGPQQEALEEADKEARQADQEAYDAAMEAFMCGRRDVEFPVRCYLPHFVRKALAAP